jgi:hypothetical protein
MNVDWKGVKCEAGCSNELTARKLKPEIFRGSRETRESFRLGEGNAKTTAKKDPPYSN